MKIYKRAIIDQIIKYLFTEDVIVLHGARQVGKTYILYWLKDYLGSQGKAVHYIDLEDSRLLTILNRGVDNFLHYLAEEGLNPADFQGAQNPLFVCIDEIQYLSDPSSFLKMTADHHKNIKLIVSGSSSFDIQTKFKDSLVGRTVDFEIHNLSFAEFLLFKEYKTDLSRIYTDKKREELAGLFKQFVLFGGYPKAVLTEDKEKKEKYIQQIIDTYVRKDIRDLAGVRDIDKFNKMLEALAAQSGQILNVIELAGTCGAAKQTIERYLNILEKTYVIRRVRPYHKNIRSELFKSPKIFFYDSGLMQMLWLKTFSQTILGGIFETAVFAELVKFFGVENVLYWRTQKGHEIDFIIKQKEKVIPYEVKMNFNRFRATAMKYFCDRYAVDARFCVSLEGVEQGKICIYPWEIGLLHG
ncbi:MAG: ATP-binding protein [Candidatus Omnitrophica bacterium]|nr:ATP-binding protein [Candidatus Omnitrophota bacterium]